MEPSVGNEAKPVSFLHILWGIRLPSGKTVTSPTMSSWANRQRIEARGWNLGISTSVEYCTRYGIGKNEHTASRMRGKKGSFGGEECIS